MENRRRFKLRYQAENETFDIEGIALNYGEEALLPWGHKERFTAGAFGNIDGILLNYQHDRTRPLARQGHGLEISDDGQRLSFKAKLPKTMEGENVRALTETGVLTGASIEFEPIESHWEGDTIVYTKARLNHIAVVDSPQYEGSLIKKLREKNPRQTTFPFVD